MLKLAARGRHLGAAGAGSTRAVKFVRNPGDQAGAWAWSGEAQGKKEPFLPAIYYALVDGGLVTSRCRSSRSGNMIDRAEARKTQNRRR